jgi:broad specificity polyphosphatase/5'/3'-nucleotidase SurE
MSSAVGDIFDHPMVAYERRVIAGAENIPAYALDAAPALCTIIGGIGYLGERPTMVVSGINAGANVGRSVLHSGTIGAILTGAQLGMSGLAVSSQWDEAITHYETAAKIAVEVLDQFYDAPERTLLNLNVPNLSTAELKGVRRGRISNAGIIKATRSEESGFTLGESGEIPLRFGAATPQLGDVSDEQADEDGLGLGDVDAELVGHVAVRNARVRAHELQRGRGAHGRLEVGHEAVNDDAQNARQLPASLGGGAGRGGV